MLARYMNVVSSSVKSTLLTIPFLFISRCSQLQYICIPFVSISFLPLPTVPVVVPSCNISSFLSSQFLFSHFSLYHLVFPVAIYLLSVGLNFFSPTSHCTIRCSQLQYILFPFVSISFLPLLTVPLRLLLQLCCFLDRRQPGPIKSVLLVIIGWLVGWLVTQFSQKRL